MEWTVETLNSAVDEEVEMLPTDMRAKLLRISNLIESKGLPQVKEPYVKHLQGKLWEIRVKGRDGIARGIYVTATGRRVVIVRVFIKKNQKTPRTEINLALSRAQEVS